MLPPFIYSIIANATLNKLQAICRHCNGCNQRLLLETTLLNRNWQGIEFGVLLLPRIDRQLSETVRPTRFLLNVFY